MAASHGIKLWRKNFELGKGLAPPIALATAASLSFCGWRERGIPTTGIRDGRLFFVSAALTVAIVPFTIFFMSSTNTKLLSLAKKDELTSSDSREGEALLKRWTLLNGLRSFLPLAGAVLAGFLVLG